MKNRLILMLALLLAMGNAVGAQARQDALVLYHNAKYKEAVQVCEEELRDNPNRVDSYVVMCWALVKDKRYAEAEERSATGLKISPYDLRLIEISAEAKYYLGKNAQAMELFERYVSNAAESASRLGNAYYMMGEIFIKQTRYQHADISISSAVKKEPLVDSWWTRLGYAREMAGNFKEAVAAYEEALKINPSSYDASRGRERARSRLN